MTVVWPAERTAKVGEPDVGNVPSERLELEITESVLLQEDENNLTILHQLRALGISIVLDDFGTGYSSFSYLQRFPFNKIKIDRSFVANLTTRPDCAAIVCAITGLAKSLDIQTTAEGVETPEQLELLRAAGARRFRATCSDFRAPSSMLVSTKPPARKPRLKHSAPHPA